MCTGQLTLSDLLPVTPMSASYLELDEMMESGEGQEENNNRNKIDKNNNKQDPSLMLPHFCGQE